MSERFKITFKAGSEAGTISFKMKTRTFGTKQEIKSALEEEFKSGLLTHIIDRVSETYSAPTSGEDKSLKHQTLEHREAKNEQRH